MKAQRLVLILSVLMLTVATGCGDENGTGSGETGPEGRLYVLNQTDGTLYIYDTRTHARLDSIDTRVARPHYIEFAPDGRHYYITTLETTGHIAKFETLNNVFVDSAKMPPAVMPSAIAITADSRFGYVCNFSSPGERTRVNKFDLGTLAQVSSVQAGAITHDLKATSDGSVIVACNRFSDDVTLIYPDADTVAHISIDPDELYPVGSHKYGPFGVVIDHRDSLAFIACMDAMQVRVLDIAQRRIVDSVDIPVTGSGLVVGPTLLAVSPDDEIVYVTTQGGSSVVAFRVSTMEVIADIPLETPNPFGITISDDGSRVYAACVNTPLAQGRVYVIDGATQTKVDSIDVGRESFGLRWRPSDP